jgi:pilus assembly protein Flp/PilA
LLTALDGEYIVNKLWNSLRKATQTLVQEEGQDLVEYALVVALISFSATAGMKGLATKLNTAFNGIGTTLNSYVS